MNLKIVPQLLNSKNCKEVIIFQTAEKTLNCIKIIVIKLLKMKF